MSAQPICPDCECREHFPVDSFGEFTFLRCSQCTLEFCDPLRYETSSYEAAYKATEETEFYVPSVRWLQEASEDLVEARWMLFAAQKEALAWLRARQPATSILDIGCGPGWFLIRARQLGFAVAGVEIGSDPVRVLQGKGYDVVCGSIEEVPLNWSPQIITLFEVLEHLPEPVKFLAQIKDRFPQSDSSSLFPAPAAGPKPASTATSPISHQITSLAGTPTA